MASWRRCHFVAEDYETLGGKQEFLPIDVKGKIPTKAKWYTYEEVEDKFPHLFHNFTKFFRVQRKVWFVFESQKLIFY